MGWGAGSRVSNGMLIEDGKLMDSCVVNRAGYDLRHRLLCERHILC